MPRGIYVLFLILVLALTPCAGAAAAAKAQAVNDPTGMQGNTTAPPVLKERYDYYDVCGCCEKDLQCDLTKKCPGSSDGNRYDSITDWKLTWDYGHDRGPLRCTAHAFTVTVNITFHLPKWVRTGDVPRALVDKWEAYERSLLAHEKEHEQIALDAAKDLTQAVADLPSSLTCEELDRNVQQLAGERSDRLIEDQKAYDAATKHGATQGAMFP